MDERPDEAAGTDGPRRELDQLLAQLIDRAEDVSDAQNRLRELLRVSRGILGELGLETVLTRIVEAACRLVDAPYGALGVVAPDRAGLEAFVHVGMDQQVASRIGHLPEGKGLLGVLLDEPLPLRLRDLSRHPRSVGFPAHHPPMRSFLGVPITVSGEVYGNLYLTRPDDRAFTAQDEELVLSLAATAGVAIENARVFEQARRRQQWLRASTEVTRKVLSGEAAPLALMCSTVLDLAEADLVSVVQPTSDGRRLAVVAAEGEHAAAVSTLTYPLDGTWSEMVLGSGRPVRIDDARLAHPDGRKVYLTGRVELGPVLVVPLQNSTTVRGVLFVARGPSRHPFSDGDVEMATTFANQASIAWELADVRRDQQKLLLLEDRERIARDLHDHVIQQLFAAGLTLQSLGSQLGDGPGEQIESVVDRLDDTVRQIRRTIFALTPRVGSLRAGVLEVVSQLSGVLGFEPEVEFDGPVDTTTPQDLVGDVAAVVREALSNVARHAGASRADVYVRAERGVLEVRVEDDGVGVGDPGRRSGLSNLRQRAEARGGVLQVGAAGDHGLLLTWRVPLS